MEKIILSNLLFNEEYGRKILPFLKEEYFSRNEKTIFNCIHDYVTKYNAFPTREALFIDLSEREKLSEEDFKNCKEVVSGLERDENTNVSWLIDKTEKFCQEKAIYNAVYSSINILDDKTGKVSRGIIPKLLSDALSVSFEAHIGHNYTEDAKERFEGYFKLEERIPLGLEKLNTITQGGFPKKTLNVFMAPTGVGKTQMMTFLASCNLMMGYNVLYITLEMAETEISKRIDANLLDIELSNIASVSPEYLMTKFNAIAKKIAASGNGKLVVKEYPTATASVFHFKHLLNELRLKKNFVPDIIYIDYINICASSRVRLGNSVNTYSLIKAIAEEMRGLGVEANAPIVTATQSNRAGFNNSDIDLDNTSESWGLPATVDFMAALIVDENLVSMNRVAVKQLKNRYSDHYKDKRFLIGVERAKMRFFDVDESENEELYDSGSVMDKTPTGMDINAEKLFNINDLKDFK